MLTIESLKEYGADVETGIKRCRKEALYLKLVGKVPSNDNFDLLKESLDQNNLDAAFEYAHGLKGVVTNLSLTPLEEPICEITELLRAREDIDYSDHMKEIYSALDKLKALL